MGTGTVTVTCNDGGNYDFETATENFAIEKDDAPTGVTHTYEVIYSDTNRQSIRFSDFVNETGWPQDIADLEFTAVYVEAGDNPYNITQYYGTHSSEPYFALNPSLTKDVLGKTSTLRIEIASANYENFTVIATVKPIDKTQKPLTVTMDGWTYGGTASTPQYTKPEDEGTETRYYKVEGENDSTYTTTVPTNAGEYTVKVSYETKTEIWIGTADFTIAKATPTGAPKYTAINTSGKTLADAALTLSGSTITVPGTVKWVDTDGNELASTTEVTANTSYK